MYVIIKYKICINFKKNCGASCVITTLQNTMWKHHTDKEKTFQCDTWPSNCEMALFNLEHRG